MNKQNFKTQLIEQLRSVMDPELGVNIVDLGLVYQIQIEGNKVKVQFTTTTPGCSIRRYLQQQVGKAISSLEGIDEYEVEKLMKPDWTLEMIKEGA